MYWGIKGIILWYIVSCQAITRANVDLLSVENKLKLDFNPDLNFIDKNTIANVNEKMFHPIFIRWVAVARVYIF